MERRIKQVHGLEANTVNMLGFFNRSLFLCNSYQNLSYFLTDTLCLILRFIWRGMKCNLAKIILKIQNKLGEMHCVISKPKLQTLENSAQNYHRVKCKMINNRTYRR